MRIQKLIAASAMPLMTMRVAIGGLGTTWINTISNIITKVSIFFNFLSAEIPFTYTLE